MVRTNINELAQQRFIATPKLLLYGEKYKDLSGNAFKTYVALYDRFTLSVKITGLMKIITFILFMI